ncbi:PAS and ANTAR domain-containing protein [Isoptericola sp. NPDC060257]|uniref:PAS and ANTAR domain-containing protein n=1 Tax=Isoptericola sp. NPDC060257 TaxID=3347087 RepID=UPI00365309EB
MDPRRTPADPPETPSPLAPAQERSALEHALDIPSAPLTGSYRCLLPEETWWWSEGTFLVHGFEPGEVVPSTALVLAHKHPDDRERVQRLLAAARRTGAPFASVHRIVDVRGYERTVVLTGEVQPTEDDPSTTVLHGFVTDVTATIREAASRMASQQVAASAQSRSAIDQAKGALMVLYGLTADDAFAVLRGASNTHNVKVRDLATAVLAAASTHGTAARPFVERLLRPAALETGRPTTAV